jgi:hypothetical protein
MGVELDRVDLAFFNIYVYKGILRALFQLLGVFISLLRTSRS